MPTYADVCSRMLTYAAGNGVKNTIINDDIACHTARAIQWAQKLDTYAALSEKDLFDVEYWELEQAKKKNDNILLLATSY